MNRHTIVIHGRLAADRARLANARAAEHGVQVMTMPALAARLAGGFLRMIDAETLMATLAEVLAAPAAAPLGDLEPIGDLPGLQLALARTFGKAWRAGLDLGGRASEHARFATLAALETAVLDRLPSGLMRPAELAAAARARLAHAPAVLGPVEVHGMTALEPVWQNLLLDLATHVPVCWEAGAREVPAWLAGSLIEVRTAAATAPETVVASCATARHEVIEALRWARALLAGGAARPEDIAIAAVSPTAFDDIVEAAAADANLPLCFAHGRSALFTRDGQAAAALADVLLRGLSQARMRRLALLAGPMGGALQALPEDWRQVLPEGAPLGTPARWQMVCDEAGESGAAVAAVLVPVVRLLYRGPEAAAEAGETILSGVARALWRRALEMESAPAVERALASLRVPDQTDPACSIVWASAAELAAAPRPFARLLGLNAHSWPRQGQEDPLLPATLVPAAELDVLPIVEADRRDFASIKRGTARELVLSFSRRDATGRLLGCSPLLPATTPLHLRRGGVPAHAMSEADRLMARPAEFATTPRSRSADAAWRDWLSPDVTAHDGRMRAGHPAMERLLGRNHSATSLKLLLRSPLGFVWKYGLGLKEPEEEAEPFRLDPMVFGTLVHKIIAASVRHLSGNGGLAGAERRRIEAAVAGEAGRIALEWQATMPLPPALLWRRTLDQATGLATDALAHPLPVLPGQTSWAEVPFNIAEAPDETVPWDATRRVLVPGTELALTGQIDRLDLSADRTQGRVVDFKTGKAPRDIGTTVLAGGQELQRCLYIAAVRSLVGEATEVEAALLYPRAEAPYYPLADADGAMATLAEAINQGAAALRAGLALPGPDTGVKYDDFLFALPTQLGSLIDRKRLAAAALMGPAAIIWGAV
jgi:hypothetical protein